MAAERGGHRWPEYKLTSAAATTAWSTRPELEAYEAALVTAARVEDALQTNDLDLAWQLLQPALDPQLHCQLQGQLLQLEQLKQQQQQQQQQQGQKRQQRAGQLGRSVQPGLLLQLRRRPSLQTARSLGPLQVGDKQTWKSKLKSG